MPTKVFKTSTEHELAPGATGHWWWNNASPVQAVWTANAIASLTGDTKTGFDQNTQLEVTRLWRKFTVTEKSTGPESDTVNETEIHYEVKNLSATKAKFYVWLCVVWQ